MWRKIRYQDKESLKCPDGTVCADVVEICSKAQPAVCKNTNVGFLGTCKECRDSSTVHKVCISETEYSICNNGFLLTALTYSCEKATPYCKLLTTNTGDVKGICSVSQTNVDCPGASTYYADSSTAGTGTNEIELNDESTPACTADGHFPITSDDTCVHFYRCEKNTSGGFRKVLLRCPTNILAFNPATQHCELSTNFVCSST
ncbi:uncharacterized protein LOC119650226 isoform X2 [Hermetia illucens]|uniref:uncharacterized protein LOC119650226 isoform X2 n=1 Tax=Hermetia illucens TaxID=343691 RepID=UPI0018CBF44B|nr:uncharacterized protein LOC119650226 isoform X2 [Hermetia illucens]